MYPHNHQPFQVWIPVDAIKKSLVELEGLFQRTPTNITTVSLSTLGDIFPASQATDFNGNCQLCCNDVSLEEEHCAKAAGAKEVELHANLAEMVRCNGYRVKVCWSGTKGKLRELKYSGQ